jgi:phosphopantetheine adenylyltransferase
MRKAISFDPITLGHEDIIKEGFLDAVVALESMPKKIYVFPRKSENVLSRKHSDEPKLR